MARKPTMRVIMTKDSVKGVAENMKYLGTKRVMVGIPEKKDHRRADDKEKESTIGNAALAYIHSNGAPEVHIPARPFLVPGIMKVRPDIVQRFKRAAERALTTGPGELEKDLRGIGQIAASAAQMVIQEGIPPPLKESTIEARKRRRAGSSYKRKAEKAHETTPLWDTGQLMRAITYVIVPRKQVK